MSDDLVIFFSRLLKNDASGKKKTKVDVFRIEKVLCCSDSSKVSIGACWIRQK